MEVLSALAATTALLLNVRGSELSFQGEEEEPEGIMGMDETERKMYHRIKGSQLQQETKSSINDSETAGLLSGISSIPSLRRSINYPFNSVPTTPAVDSTLTQLPFSCPPSHVINNPTFLSTLRSRPDLFAVSTPINIPNLRKWLEPHPNRLLVESVLVGLEEGFWPGHDGYFEKYDSKPLPKHSPEDDAFLVESAQKDFERGWMSSTFDSLLPGMLISPSHVI